MSERKTISSSFSVSTIQDGESAPYYTLEWYAWSNDTSTASATTAPTISGSWQEYIPSQGGYSYLWKKIVRYDFNASTREYDAQTAQYFRMSGTNGTSIRTKGSVDYQNSSQGSGTALNLISNPSDGDAYVVGLDLQGNTGWLYQWVAESNSWIPLGQFKGESGKTYYSHLVWATYVKVSTLGLVQRIDGYLAEKDSNDTTHNWMGVFIDENPLDPTSGSDPILLDYTWTNIRGDDAVVYKIKTSIESVKIPSDQTTTSKSISITFSSQAGAEAEQSFSTYYSIYYRDSMNAYSLIYPSYNRKEASLSYTFSDVSSTKTNIVIFVWGEISSSAYRGQFPEGQHYLTKKEIPILKDGDTGQAGERGKVGRFYYYSGFDWDADNVDDTFVVNDAQVPYFSKAGSNANKYYVFNPETIPASGEMTMAQMAAETSVGGQIQWNEAPWEVMTDDFKYLITKAIFGDYAEFGSFIINGDWLFSKLGQWLGNTTTDNGKVNYYAFNNGSISYVKNSPVYGYVNPNNPSQSSGNIYRDATNVYDEIYYPITEGSYLNLTRGTMYYLQLRCVKCKVYLCYENYEVELQQFPTAQQEGGLVIDSNSYYIGSWLFQVKQNGQYLIKVVRDDASESYRPSTTVTWITIDEKFFRPKFAVNGYNGKMTANDISADGAFNGAARLTSLSVYYEANEDGKRGDANFGGVTTIEQPYFPPDKTDASITDYSKLPILPYYKNIKVRKKDATGAEYEKAGHLVVDESTGVLKFVATTNWTPT